MASPTSKSSTPTVRVTYSRRWRQIPATIPAAQPVPKVQPSIKKFSAAWWKEARAAGAHRRAVFLGPLTRAGNYEDDSKDEEHARIQEIAVTKPQQGTPKFQELDQATEKREVRSKREPDKLIIQSQEPSRTGTDNVSLDLLAATAIGVEESQAGPSEPVIRRKGKEPMVSEDEEESFWEDCVQFFAEQDSEDDEEGPAELVQRDETVEEGVEEEEQQLRPPKQQLPRRTTLSALKRQHIAASVGRPAAKRTKKVIVIDSGEVTDHSDSDSDGLENLEVEAREEAEEAEVEEEEVERVEDREVM